MTTAEPIHFGICSDTHSGTLPRWADQVPATVLHAGDVYDAPSLLDNDYPSLRDWVEAQNVPVLAVRGNHDYRDPGGFFRAAEDISGRLLRLRLGLWVAGIGLAPREYYDVPGETDLEPQCRELIWLAQRRITPGERVILLTHYPPKLPELPWDQVPAGWTYRCIAQLVEELQPVAIVQGHLHEWFGQQWRRPDGTLIVSPGPGGGVLSVAIDGIVFFHANG